MLPTKFQFIWPNGCRGKDGPKRGRKHLWKVLYGNFSFRFDPLTNMAIIDNSCFLLVDFSESARPNDMKLGSLLMDRDKMSILYREPSIDASYQVSVHLAKQFQRRKFLEINQLETRIACGSHIS
jgi:hypothetical protein